jgi:MFS family permease
MGGDAWMMIAIKLCSHEYTNWCDIVEDNVYLGASLSATAPFGGFLACLGLYFYGGNKLGGRTELILASMFYTIGSTMEAESAEITKSVAGLYVCFIGRFIYGWGLGFSLHAIPNFIAEHSPPNLRGTLCAFIEVFITVGQIYSYAIGQWLTYEFPYDYPWKYTFKFGTLFGIFMFFGMLSLPDSPRWLVSTGRPLYEALEAAQYVNPDMTSEAIVMLKKDIERQMPRPINGVTMTPLERLCSPMLRIPCLVGFGLVFAMQLVGLPSMLYYCVEVFKEVAPTSLMYALGSFAGCKMLGSLIVMAYMDTWGRRASLIGGLLLMFLSSGALFLFFYDSLQHDGHYKWGFVVLLDLFVIGFEFSVGSVTFALLGEIFPGDVKGEALSIAFMINFFLAGAMIFLVYWEISEIGYSIVWAQFSIAAFVFLFFSASLVPETMNKTLEQIQKEFQEEFDVPDFLTAVEYLSEATGSASDQEPLVNNHDTDEERGAAESTTTSSSATPKSKAKSTKSDQSKASSSTKTKITGKKNTTTNPLSVDNDSTPLI